MGQYNRTLPFTLTASDGTAYAVSATAYEQYDVVGGLARVRYGTEGGALLRQIKVLDYHNQSEPYIIHIYRSTPSTIADAAAFAPTDADGLLEIGQVTVNAANYDTANGSAYSVAYKKGADVDIDVPGVAQGTIYVYNECADTPDYNATTDLVFEYTFWID